MDKLREKIRQIYKIAAELNKRFPERTFMPDGLMVGSLGEVIAKVQYGVELFRTNHPQTDITGRRPAGRG